MAHQTNVQSIDALRRFRAVLQKYGESVQDVLDTLTMESQRTVDWIQLDRMQYWPAEVRRATDALSNALNALQMKQLTQNGRDPPAATEERANVHRTRERLRLAEDKTRRTRVLSQTVEQQAEEYRGCLGKLAQLIECDIPQALAALDRMMEALERYTQIRSSPTPSIAPSTAVTPPRGPTA